MICIQYKNNYYDQYFFMYGVWTVSSDIKFNCYDQYTKFLRNELYGWIADVNYGLIETYIACNTTKDIGYTYAKYGRFFEVNG